MAGSLQKCRLNFLLDEVKNSMNAGKNILMNEDCGDENYDGMETQLADARNLICEITDKIDCLNTNEALRKQLPSAHWASWNGEAEGYLDFKLSMKTHLNSLTSEKLKLSTLKSKITGKSADSIKMELVGVQTLEQAFQILDRKFGSISKQLPAKLHKLQALKEPRQWEVDVETENIIQTLNYIRVCIEYEAEENINELFCAFLAKKFREETGKEFLATKGNLKILVPLLEEAKSKNESWTMCKPSKFYDNQQTSKDSNKRGENIKFNNVNNYAPKERGKLPCYICSRTGHIAAFCYNLAEIKSLNEKLKFLKKSNICEICVKPNLENHVCYDKYKCEVHKVNRILCCKGKSENVVEARINANNFDGYQSNERTQNHLFST